MIGEEDIALSGSLLEYYVDPDVRAPRGVGKRWQVVDWSCRMQVDSTCRWRGQELPVRLICISARLVHSRCAAA